MKLVVLDGHGLNPGDISWQGLEALGELTLYERTDGDESLIIERIGDADAIFTNKVPLTQAIFEACRQLKYVGVLATGYNVVDLVAAKEQGIVVTNIPSYGTDAVAQFTFALLLEMTSQVGLHVQSVREGEWEKSIDFTYMKSPLMELAGKTIGLIGYGQIAQAVAEIAHAFKMRVIYYNHRPKGATNAHFRQVSLEELYSEADIISLHVPQFSTTEKMINQAAIGQMKHGVIIINTARGGLLDEEAVADGLNNGQIGGLGADVVSVEPIRSDNPLLRAKNCYLTPHIAWAPQETRERLMAIVVANYRGFLADNVQNRVN